MPYSDSMFRDAHGKLVALVVVALIFLAAATEAAQAQTVSGKSATGLSSLPAEMQRGILDALGKDVNVTWVQQAELASSDGAAYDNFGFSVAVDGSTVVVGAPGQKVGSNGGQGAVYIFVKNGETWIQQAELTASDGNAGDQLGYSVSVSGGTVVAGAWLETGGSVSQGAAYVFSESGGTWTQQAKLTAADGAGFDYFGTSVAVSGGTAAVVGGGRAYVFVQSGSTWSQQAELTAGNGFFSVAVDNNILVAGAVRQAVGSNQDQGSAYVFARSGTTWTQQAELTASDGGAYDSFGVSVAVSGGIALVGAVCHPASRGGAYCGPGAAYMFGQSDRGTWTQQAELTASDGKSGDDFGRSVSTNGSSAVVGARCHLFSGGCGTGAAYVFVESSGTWSQQAKLTGSNVKRGDGFGMSVAASGMTAVVGVSTFGSNPIPGSAYVFVPGAPAALASPASIKFGNEALNIASTAKVVVLRNTGTATLNIGGIDITPSANFKISSNTCTSALAAGKLCRVSVEFDPTALGAFTASLVFTDDASSSPQTVQLAGTGIADATLTPANATYAAQNVGTTSAAKTFTLTNNQTAALTGIAISTTGDFAVSGTTCGTSLAAKGKCTISVVFKPTATGTRTGQLKVSESTSNSPQTSSLKGTGK